jgi:hypothetical protein
MANVQHNLNNIIIDRVLRGIYSTDKDGIIFSLNQIQNFSLNCTSESQEVVDAMGVSIMEFMRSKSIEASAENAIFDLGLMAAQSASSVKKATAGNTVVAPAMESHTAEAGTDGKIKTWTLKGTPLATPAAIYELNGDSTLGKKIDVVTTADNGKASYSSGVITLPTDAVAGTEYFIMYEYNCDNAAEVITSADKFPSVGKMTFECLVYDVCDPEVKLFAYVILPRFQLKSDFDWSIGGDSQTHPFSGKAMQEYCARDNKLFEIIIVDGDDDAI